MRYRRCPLEHSISSFRLFIRLFFTFNIYSPGKTSARKMNGKLTECNHVLCALWWA